MNEEKALFTVAPEDSGERLDSFLSNKLESVSRSAIQLIMERGGVSVNGGAVRKSRRLRSGDTVCIVLPPPEPCEALPENIPLDIVYEDRYIIVVNKQKGMVVHPAPGNRDGTLVNALLYHCGESLSGINGVMRPGIVHRIDKNTSGLIVAAKTDAAHASLAEQIKAHTCRREYEAITEGHLKQDSGVVDAPIGRHVRDRIRMAVNQPNSREAVTHYEVLQRLNGFDYVHLRLETGRTHQIRVHMAHLGHPVAGDDLYGGTPRREFEGQCLHARLLTFTHPETGERVSFSAELPEYFVSFLTSVGGTAR